ncbi:hypothetical protein WN55_08179 [Dufourea novaeangliae]|uniref:Circadian clock-controlled protein n=1 Tax=Dufourea novaeangliae TaxID=178035 RepID=A0A154P518_DUFNO|nr:hypothetical protein WN55_08179 [Dufourea novaeangliae]
MLSELIEAENYAFGEGALVGFLEKMKESLKKGDSKIGIPILDPLKVDHVDLNLNHKLVQLEGTLDNIKAHGLSNYKVNRGDFKLGGFVVNASLTWNDIDLLTKYKITHGKLIDAVSFFGEGIISAVVQGLTVEVNTKLSINDDMTLYVRTMDVSIHLKKFDLVITGLFDDAEMSKLISQIASELLPDLIDDYQQQLSKVGNKLVTNLLDGILSKLTLEDLLDMIGNK